MRTGEPFSPDSSSRIASFSGSSSMILKPLPSTLKLFTALSTKVEKYFSSAFFGIRIFSLVMNGFSFDPSTSEMKIILLSSLIRQGELQITSIALFLRLIIFPGISRLRLYVLCSGSR